MKTTQELEVYRDEPLNDNAMERNALLNRTENNQKITLYSLIAGLPVIGEAVVFGIPAITNGAMPELASIDFLQLGIYTAIFSGISFFATGFASKNNKYQHLTKTALGSNTSKHPEHYQLFGKIITADSGKTLINSFPIYRDHEVNINAWVSPEYAVDGDSSTHTVKHYIVKDKTEVKLEQEVIANVEAMWDLSADTLVEAYGIQEK